MASEPRTASVTERICVTGVVQGVGFRPFVYRLANDLGLSGHVGNDSSEVFVEVSGSSDAVDQLVQRMREEAPPLAVIEGIRRQQSSSQVRRQRGFRIVASETATGARTLVPPDVAVCDDCRRELFDPNDRRYLHPFITCTNCGPRYTIIRSLPYDRPHTTLAHFPMCAACRAEYEDPADRRYHAQPISCHDCGPTLAFRHGTEQSADELPADPIQAAADALRRGEIVAVRGVGGYHLVCSARDEQALARLRERKHRPEKPFAVMVRNLGEADSLVELGLTETDILTSAAAPIALCRSRPERPLSKLVAPGNPLLGVLLPYAPIHHLLLAAFGGPLVVTSANHRGEPIAHRRRDIERLGGLEGLWDALLDHDRPILAPCDDSVVRVANGQLLPIRRARGYAPVPVAFDGDRPVLAAGCELKNTFCVAAHGHAWVSPHIGDMENLATLEVFEERVASFLHLYDLEPEVTVCDDHPGYLSSRWVREHHREHSQHAQHHHAHIAAVMAEHQIAPAEPVLGFAFDGTGYGSDGAIWGGEVLRCTGASFERLAHLAPIQLPGGDQAIRHPARVALAHLHAAGIDWADDLPPLSVLAESELTILCRQLDTGTGCTPTTSMGRLFDAVASLIGLRHEISYEAQAAIDLEHVAANCEHAGGAYSFEFLPADPPPGEMTGTLQIGCRPLLTAIVRDLRMGTATCCIARRFHAAVAQCVADLSDLFRGRNSAKTTVALSGGVFQNALITQQCIERLEGLGHRVLVHHVVPPNDGGLALGQAYIAAHRGTKENPPCV